MSLLRCPRADAVGWAAPEAEDDNNNEKDNGRKAHNRRRQKKRKIADDESNNLAADQPTSNYAVSDAGVGAPNSISTAPQDVTSTTTGTLSTETTGIAGSAADLDGSAHEAEAAVTTLNSTENISDAVTLTSTAEEYDRTDTADSNPANDDGSTIVTFDPRGSEIVITGTATVTVLDGRVEIMGCIIGSTDEIPCVQVCSPDGSWSSSLAILDVSATIKKGQEENEFASSCNTITRIKISPLPWDRSEASSTCTFHVASRSDVRFAITVADRWKAAATAVLSDMHKPPNASGPVEYALDPARVVVCGAKSVGKSTYVRYLVNKMMTCCTDRNGKRIRVAVLDCDVGQPELGPPGLITLTILERPLLSPPHIHMICNGQAQDSACAHGKETNFEAAPGHASARFFGSVSAKADPSSYVAAIASLLSQYETLAKKEYQDERNQHECGAFPLVVNTSGWVKGMGFEILSSIVDAVKPGHIIQIVGAARAKFFDLTPHAFEGRSIHVVEAFGSMSRLPTEQDMTPPQSRSVSPIPPSTTAGVDRAAACNETAVLTKPNAADTSTVPATSTLRSLRFASYFLGGYKPSARFGCQVLAFSWRYLRCPLQRCIEIGSHETVLGTFSLGLLFCT